MLGAQPLVCCQSIKPLLSIDQKDFEKDFQAYFKYQPNYDYYFRKFNYIDFYLKLVFLIKNSRPCLIVINNLYSLLLM